MHVMFSTKCKRCTYIESVRWVQRWDEEVLDLIMHVFTFSVSQLKLITAGADAANDIFYEAI